MRGSQPDAEDDGRPCSVWGCLLCAEGRTAPASAMHWFPPDAPLLMLPLPWLEGVRGEFA